MDPNVTSQQPMNKDRSSRSNSSEINFVPNKEKRGAVLVAKGLNQMELKKLNVQNGDNEAKMSNIGVLSKSGDNLTLASLKS